MCFALYIGTDERLPTELWDDERQRFFLHELEKRELSVKAKFTKSNVCYAGSWQGCGCGWFSDDEKSAQCIEELLGVINQQLCKYDSVELYCCWEGDQKKRIKRTLDLTPDNFKGSVLPLNELDFAVIRRANDVEPENPEYSGSVRNKLNRRSTLAKQQSEMSG